MSSGLRMMMMLSLLAGCSVPQQAPEPEALPALAGSSWLVEDIGGTGVLDMLQSTLDFAADQGVSGNGGCNRFTGQADVSGTDMRMGPLAATRMACPEAVMNQERRYFIALDSAVQWQLDTGRDILTMTDRDGNTVLRFSRRTGEH